MKTVTPASSGTAVLEPTLARPSTRAEALARLRARLAGGERAPRVALAVMVGAGAALVLLA